MKAKNILMCLMILGLMVGLVSATGDQSTSSSSSSSSSTEVSSSASSSAVSSSVRSSSIASSTLPSTYNCHAMGNTVLYGLLIGSVVCIVIAAYAVINMGGNVMEIGIAAVTLILAAIIVSVIYGTC